MVNDFSGMDLIDVGFRGGIDLTQQRLPSGPEYVYLPDVAATVSQAKPKVMEWEDPELRDVALTMIKTLQEEFEEGQRQALLREDDYHGYSALPCEAVERFFALLRGDVM